MFFESEEDRERAINRSINYYNTRLYWKENLVPHPKRYEEKWSSENKKKQSSNSSNAEIEGESKGDYLQLKEIEEKVKEEQTKVHEEKKRIGRQRDADREVRQEQYLNTDIYNLLQKLSERIEVMGKRGPNRS